MLSFFREDILAYFIKNDFIKSYFSNYFQDVSSYNIKNINLDFEIPKNIFSWNKDFSEFKNKLNILRYTYFKLKESYQKLEESKSIIQDSQIKLSENRNDILLETLRKTISLYEDKLREFLWKFK